MLWATASSLLALPFAALWSKNRSAARWRAPLALLASVPPPLGIIGWANPLTAAGILFPGTGLFGLGAVLIFAAISPRHFARSIAGVAVLAILASLTVSGTPPPFDWEATNTEFGDMSPEGANMFKQFETAQYIQQRAIESPARVIIFPEAVVTQWTEATDAFWQPTFSHLAENGRSILVGTAVEIPGTRNYANVVIVRGVENNVVIQRFHAPLARGYSLSDSAAARSRTGPGVIEIAGERIVLLIGYEQFLTWPVLTSALSHPTLLVGVASNPGRFSTRIRYVQSVLVRAWGELFRVPSVTAANR